MNQVRDWNGICQRCSITTDSHIMSMFDVSLICMKCWESEKSVPSYTEARNAEVSAIKSGNMNFKGIGYPSRKELHPGMEWEEEKE